MLLKITLITSLLFAQGIIQKLGRAPAGGSVGTVEYLASPAHDSNPNPSFSTFEIDLASGGSNRTIALFFGVRDTGSVTVSSVSGAGATWSQIGGQISGNGAFKGFCWVGIGPTATGITALTVNMSGEPSEAPTVIVGYHLSGAKQSTDGYACSGATSGDLTISLATGGMAVSVMYDTSDTRTVSGCTTTQDIVGYTSTGYAGAHCSSASSTFTWNSFGGTSIALGLKVDPQ